MAFSKAVFGFLKEAARKDVGPNHRAAGVCIKIACWITFVVFLLAAIAGVGMGIFVLTAEGVWMEPLQDSDADQEFKDFAADHPTALGVLVLLGTALVVTILLLVLWWQNHAFHAWNQVAPNGLVWAVVLAAIMLAFSVGGGRNMATMVLAVLILVFANVSASKGELDGTRADDDSEA